MALSYLEDLGSQIPAIQLLHGLGWEYLSQSEALALRNNHKDQVILTSILRPWLEKNNRIQAKGETHPFNDANIHEAIRRLIEEPYDGLVRTNEKIYHRNKRWLSIRRTINHTWWSYVGQRMYQRYFCTIALRDDESPWINSWCNGYG